MEGEIKQLNLSLRNMVSKLSSIVGILGKFKLSIITFNAQVNVIQLLEDVDKIVLKELFVRDLTSMGAVFEKVSSSIPF